MASVHEICDRFVDDFAAAHPVAATELGIPGYDDQLTDYSPEGHAARAALSRRALDEIRRAEATDPAERSAKAVFTERVGLDLEISEAGLDLAALNVIASPVQDLRMVFDLMPTDTEEQWATIAARLAKVPGAVDGIRASLLAAAEAGNTAALRQVTKVAEQAETWAGLSGDKGFFENLVANGPEVLRADLDRGARAAQEAYAELAGFLRAELAPKARVKDAVGEHAYRLWSRYFTGAALDPREAYEWGWGEFSRLEAEMREVAARIKPGATLHETAEALDADPKYRVHGRRQFEQWMQRLSDTALNELRGKHFDIPDEVMALECRIAPPGGGAGAYYTGPSEDFSRPGQMWWSLPPGREEFSTWREVSTVYHEGVPGHHLQIATAVYERSLNRFQRMLAFTSGHGEGWALYAERLMQDLGYLSDDGELFGMLSEQLFRAGRVLVDFGMHLELEIPKGTGFHEGERWTPELGLEFMLTRTITDPPLVHDEIDRYLGWPGQAPAYKLGERLWLEAREDARRRQGAAFDIKDFHTKALRLGGMGLDTLRQQLNELD
ncbi:uncharacterized protein (DUF885 family) [Amycolatopsis bartoniae]|uniref:DUF885 domain-containing protein n=1 Tax=Amycolatopsis bartoniae TaxID=941986 RepID=A0A8H9J0F6_9PSEU|nr:DUF885 domain-containing protein [Amycolatopsis bartoniae]MBB2933983.1 uncharacterized protein (DUF885 family) [Amycolatopsis bartoniae]TVT02793.1 DUF885 domain-containing protein [Amycolatopsis bartoniae]GHF86140.1 hypothetical protein GCM10017566_70030 [Amycolatopsis bartoniae]